MLVAEYIYYYILFAGNYKDYTVGKDEKVTKLNIG